MDRILRRARSGKRRRTEDAQGSSSRFSYGDGSYLFFQSDEALHRFLSSFEQREILPPRYLPLGNLPGLVSEPITESMEEQGLDRFCGLRKTFIIEPLVRAFYSNLRRDEDGVLSTNVNGQDILLSEENIHRITGLHNEGISPDEYFNTYTNFDEVPFLNEIGVGDLPERGRRPAITPGMRQEHRVLLYLITRVIKPRKFSHTTMTKEDVRLMHIISQGVALNWCRFVLLHMYDAVSTNRPLPYAPLIMALLEAHDIDISNAPKTKESKHWEIKRSSFRGHEGEEEEPAPQQRRQRPPRAPEQASLDTIATQLQYLTTTVNRLDTNVTRIGEEVSTYGHEMHDFFDSVGYVNYKSRASGAEGSSRGGDRSGAPSVPPRTSIRWMDEDEGSEEANEEYLVDEAD